MTLITETIPRALGVLGQKQRRRPNIYFLLKNHNITLLTQCVQILSFQRVISVKCFRVLPWARLALSSKCGVCFSYAASTSPFGWQGPAAVPSDFAMLGSFY